MAVRARARARVQPDQSRLPRHASRRPHLTALTTAALAANHRHCPRCRCRRRRRRHRTSAAPRAAVGGGIDVRSPPRVAHRRRASAWRTRAAWSPRAFGCGIAHPRHSGSSRRHGCVLQPCDAQPRQRQHAKRLRLGVRREVWQGWYCATASCHRNLLQKHRDFAVEHVPANRAPATGSSRRGQRRNSPDGAIAALLSRW